MGELQGAYAVWLREFKVFQRERSRVVASIASPLLWLLFFGVGLGSLVEVEGLRYQTFIYPGLVVMAVLFGGIFYGLYIVWDRKLDFLKEVLAAPVRRTSIFAGKVLGGATDALVQAAILLALGDLLLPLLQPGFGGLPLQGILLSIPVVLALAVAVVSLGLAIGSMFESFEGFQAIVAFVAFPLLFLSGAFYPLDTLPPVLGAVVGLNPLTYAVDLLRTLLLGTGAMDPLVSGGVLLGFAAAMVALGAAMFRRMR